MWGVRLILKMPLNLSNTGGSERITKGQIVNKLRKTDDKK